MNIFCSKSSSLESGKSNTTYDCGRYSEDGVSHICVLACRIWPGFGESDLLIVPLSVSIVTVSGSHKQL